MKNKHACIFLLLFILIVSCQTNRVRPTLNPGWAEVTLTAKGMGAPPADAVNEAQSRLMACEAARKDALRQLEEQVYGVQIDSKTYVRNFIVQNDEIRTGADGFIKSAHIINRKENPDGSCEVTLQLYLGKRFEEIIMQ